MNHKGNKPLGAISEHWIKIIQASFYRHENIPVWLVKLAVGKGQKEVEGWIFFEPDFMEIRFERHLSMEPPGFLSGRYLTQGVSDSSLALLYDSPCKEDLAYIESYIKKFIEKCKFCVRTLMDISTATYWQEAISYRYGISTIPIRRERI